MEQFANKISIERAQNGYMVRINEDMTIATMRPLPYVFETMDNLLEFVKNEFNKKLL